MNIPTLDNYKTWDNTESVKFTNVATNGLTEFALAAVKRRAPTFKELVASGGVYTGQDLVWLVPVRMVTNAGAKTPKPADIITDSDANKWTILETSLNTLKSVYRCVTRNLILAADLRDTLTVKRPQALTTDAAGGRSYAYDVIYKGIACRFQEITAAAIDERGQRLTRKTYTVWVERRLSLTIEDQVINQNDVTYEITGWQDADRIDQLQQITCERR